MRFNILIAAALTSSVLAWAPAMADDNQPGGAPAQTGSWQPPEAPAAGDKNEVICKDIHKTGSRLQVDHVCMTRADWELQAKAARDATAEQQRRGAPQITH